MSNQEHHNRLSWWGQSAERLLQPAQISQLKLAEKRLTSVDILIGGYIRTVNETTKVILPECFAEFQKNRDGNGYFLIEITSHSYINTLSPLLLISGLKDPVVLQLHEANKMLLCYSV